MRLIAAEIRAIEEEYPDIKFHIHSGNAEDVTERLDKGLLDFGVLIGYTDVERYEFLRLPVTDTWGVFMKKSSPLAEKEAIRAEDLWDLPLICSRQALNTARMRSWMRKSPEKLNIVTTYNLIYNASLLVEEGVGYALGLDKLINITNESSICFRPLEPRMEVNIDFVWKKYQVFSKPAELFLKRMQERF